MSETVSATAEPKSVVYCGVCGVPPEYCEFGSEFEKCKAWLAQQPPLVQAKLAGLSLEEFSSAEGGPGEAGSSSSSSAPAPSATPANVDDKAAAPAAPKAASKGKKKAEKQEVIVEKVTRSKRKSVTSIKGMDLFGVKLADAAKKLGKKFACGASVTKGPTEKEQIDVQGDIILDIADFITETWPEVPRSSIFLIEDGTKSPAY